MMGLISSLVKYSICFVILYTDIVSNGLTKSKFVHKNNRLIYRDSTTLNYAIHFYSRSQSHFKQHHKQRLLSYVFHNSAKLISISSSSLFSSQSSFSPSSSSSLSSSSPFSTYSNYNPPPPVYTFTFSLLSDISSVSTTNVNLTYDRITQILNAIENESENNNVIGNSDGTSSNHNKLTNAENSNSINSSSTTSSDMKTDSTSSANRTTSISKSTTTSIAQSIGSLSITNSANMLGYLLQYSLKAKYANHIITLTSMLLNLELLTFLEFSDILSYVCEEISHADGLLLLDKGVASSLDLSVHIFSPLLKTCGNARNARNLFQRMEFLGFVPNVISFTTAIKSCEIQADWRGALEIFSVMKSVGVLPNERTHACIISAASRGLAADVALNILNEMTLNHFPPNMICYGGALTACARAGLWAEVQELMTTMVKSNMVLNQSVLSSVINVCRMPPLQLPSTSYSYPTSTTSNTINYMNSGTSSSSNNNNNNNALTSPSLPSSSSFSSYPNAVTPITSVTATTSSATLPVKRVWDSSSSANKNTVSPSSTTTAAARSINDNINTNSYSPSSTSTSGRSSSDTNNNRMKTINTGEVSASVTVSTHLSPINSYGDKVVPISGVQWERAVQLFDTWVDKIQGRNESLFTLVMGICEVAGQYEKVIDIYFKMSQYKITPTRNSCRFALRACVAGEMPIEALYILKEVERFGFIKTFMLVELLVLCERLGRCDCSVELMYWILHCNYSYTIPISNLRTTLTTILATIYPSTDTVDTVTNISKTGITVTDVYDNSDETADTTDNIVPKTTVITTTVIGDANIRTSSVNITQQEQQPIPSSSSATATTTQSYSRQQQSSFSTVSQQQQQPKQQQPVKQIIPPDMQKLVLVIDYLAMNMTYALPLDLYSPCVKLLLQNGRYDTVKFLLKNALSLAAATQPYSPSSSSSATSTSSFPSSPSSSHSSIFNRHSSSSSTALSSSAPSSVAVEGIESSQTVGINNVQAPPQPQQPRPTQQQQYPLPITTSSSSSSSSPTVTSTHNKLNQIEKLKKTQIALQLYDDIVSILLANATASIGSTIISSLPLSMTTTATSDTVNNEQQSLQSQSQQQRQQHQKQQLLQNNPLLPAIAFILILMKDLNSFGHSKKIIELIGRCILILLSTKAATATKTTTAASTVNGGDGSNNSSNQDSSVLGSSGISNKTSTVEKSTTTTSKHSITKSDSHSNTNSGRLKNKIAVTVLLTPEQDQDKNGISNSNSGNSNSSSNVNDNNIKSQSSPPKPTVASAATALVNSDHLSDLQLRAVTMHTIMTEARLILNPSLNINSNNNNNNNLTGGGSSTNISNNNMNSNGVNGGASSSNNANNNNNAATSTASVVTTLPPKLYKIVASIYRDANMPELMSEMYRQASEDNAADRALRDIVLSTVSSFNTGSSSIGGSGSSVGGGGGGGDYSSSSYTSGSSNNMHASAAAASSMTSAITANAMMSNTGASNTGKTQSSTFNTIARSTAQQKQSQQQGNNNAEKRTATNPTTATSSSASVTNKPKYSRKK